MAGVPRSGEPDHRLHPRPPPPPDQSDAHHTARRSTVGLIRSPRHTAEDLEAWARWERYDRMLADDRSLARQTERAQRIAQGVGADGPRPVGGGRGKDSVGVAHPARPDGG